MRLKRAMLLALIVALVINTLGLGGSAAYAANEISSLVLNKNEVSLEVGGTATLTATAVLTNGSTEAVTVKTEWNSGSPDIASVYAGVITAKSEGKAVITATYLGKTVVVNVTVVKKVRSLIKDKQKIDLRKGGSEEIVLTAYYDDGTNEDVTKKAEWSIDNGSVATVVNGKVTGHSSGTALVTAKYNSQSVSVPVNIEIVKRVDPSKKEVSLLLGKSETLELNATYPDGTVKNVASDAEWVSADPEIADVIKGKITGYGPGQTKITANYGTKSTSIIVEVDKTGKLELNKSTLLMKKNDSEQLKLTAIYADDSTEDITSRAVWTSSNEEVVTVIKGKLVALASGEAEVTAKYGNREISVSIDVDVPRLLISSQDEVYIQTGKDVNLTVKATYADGSNKDVTSDAVWSVDDSAVAYVSKGKITTYKAGNAVVTAKYGDKSVKINVYVDIPTTLVLSSKILNFQIGSYEQLTLKALFTDGREEDVTAKAEWKTDSTSVVDVRKGLVTGIATGAASVTAKYGTRTVTAAVSVGVLKSLTTSVDTELNLARGAEKLLTASATYTDGTKKDVTKEAVWESSNTKTATISEEGKLKAVASGSAEITATFGGKTLKFDVQVDLADSLTANPAVLSFDLNEVKTITLTAKDRDGASVNVSDKAEWTSSNTAIVTVEKGVVTPVARGKATITAKYGGKSVTISIEVGVVQSISVSKRLVSLKTGTSVQIVVTALMSDGSKKDVTSSTEWKSSSYKIADVENGLVTGIGPGSATVTASFGGKTATASIDVDSLKYLKTSLINVQMKDGATIKVKALATYTDLTEEDVSVAGLWKSSNIRVVDVKDGEIKATGKGKATITVTFAKMTAKVYITVE